MSWPPEQWIDELAAESDYDAELVREREADLLAAGAIALARLTWVRAQAAHLIGRAKAAYLAAGNRYDAGSLMLTDEGIVREAAANRALDALLSGFAGAIVAMRGER
jgi:hypothetical protein